jgi:hypothetical protein
MSASNCTQPKGGPKALGHSLAILNHNMQTTVSATVNDDPVRSYFRADRSGPNPMAEWCYLQKTKACQRFYKQD